MNDELSTKVQDYLNGSIPKSYKKSKAGVYPEKWKVLELGKVLMRVRKPVKVKMDEVYKQIGIRSHGRGIFYKEAVSGEKLGNKSVFWIEPDCFIVNIVFAWEMAIGKTTKCEDGMIASHRFPMYKPKNNEIDIDYLTYYFKSNRGKYLLELASPGGAGRNKTLGQTEFMKLKVPLPSLEEQRKISSILSTWDKAIEYKERYFEEKIKQKTGIMQRLLAGKFRLQDFDEKWKLCQIKDLLDYEQPTQYIVENLVEFDKEKIPVLTANKSFVLGSTNDEEGIFDKLPVIIFDDFTTAIKFVDFRFKVKSSAIKILSTKKEKVNLKYIFEVLQILHLPKGNHKRYYISEVQNMNVELPSAEEQIAIVNISQTIDKEIKLLEKELFELRQQKKGLMQLLLTGIVRVNTD